MQPLLLAADQRRTAKPEALKLVFGIQPGDLGNAAGIDADPHRLVQQLGAGLDLRRHDILQPALDGVQRIARRLAHDVLDGIAGDDLLIGEGGRGHEALGEVELEILISLKSKAAAEAHDRRIADATFLRKPRHAHMDDLARMGADETGDTRLGARHVGAFLQNALQQAFTAHA